MDGVEHVVIIIALVFKLRLHQLLKFFGIFYLRAKHIIILKEWNTTNLGLLRTKPVVLQELESSWFSNTKVIPPFLGPFIIKYDVGDQEGGRLALWLTLPIKKKAFRLPISAAVTIAIAVGHAATPIATFAITQASSGESVTYVSRAGIRYAVVVHEASTAFRDLVLAREPLVAAAGSAVIVLPTA